MPQQKQWAALLAALRSPIRSDDRQARLVQTLELAHDIGPGTMGCSLTEIDGAGFRTPAFSTELALELDQVQYQVSSGPCVSAVRDRQVQYADLAHEHSDGRWSVLAAAATQRGVRSSFSFPVSGPSHPTALNVYSSVPAAFISERNRNIAALIARCIAAVSTGSYTFRPLEAQSDTASDPEVRRALDEGRVVARAVNAVMRQTGSGRSEAFGFLARQSRTGRESIAAAAERVLSSEGGGNGARP